MPARREGRIIPALRWCLIPVDVAEGKRWFDNLAAQGQIEMDWQETFWAQGFGKVSDRFGVPWMINVVKHQPAT